MTELERLRTEVQRLKRLNPDTPASQYAAQLYDAKRLLDELHTELLTAGYREDDTLRRIKVFLGKTV